MSDHSHAALPPMQAETPEAFLADRQSFWNGFTKFTLWVVIFIVLLLIGMAVFLL
jgi:Bacterial aa3 type cytochrome c oxidase subunit IV